jgi:UTP--glucose-1-phosphate uridylyltransferase
MMCKEGKVYAQTVECNHLDTGNKLSWMKTNIVFGLRDKEMGAQLKDFLEEQLKK